MAAIDQLHPLALPLHLNDSFLSEDVKRDANKFDWEGNMSKLKELGAHAFMGQWDTYEPVRHMWQQLVAASGRNETESQAFRRYLDSGYKAKDADIALAMVVCTLVQTGAATTLPPEVTSRAQLMREIRASLAEDRHEVPPYIGRVYAARLTRPLTKKPLDS